MRTFQNYIENAIDYQNDPYQPAFNKLRNSWEQFDQSLNQLGMDIQNYQKLINDSDWHSLNNLIQTLNVIDRYAETMKKSIREIWLAQAKTRSVEI